MTEIMTDLGKEINIQVEEDQSSTTKSKSKRTPVSTRKSD